MVAHKSVSNAWIQVWGWVRCVGGWVGCGKVAKGGVHVGSLLIGFHVPHLRVSRPAGQTV